MAGPTRGRSPMATHLKLLRGNPGKHPLNHFEPKPEIASEIPEPPKFLKGYAVEEWKRLIEELYRLKLVTVVDINTLAAYCQAYCRWREAEEALAKIAANDPKMSGLVVKSHKGTAIANPLVTIAEKAAYAMVRYASEFGLTPAARTRITAHDAHTAAFKKKFDGLIATG
jgi:P27 family predicted phage terminase small subunit